MIVVSQLIDGCPNRMLYEVLALITRYRIFIVLLAFPFAEGGIELDVAFNTNPLTREADHMVVVRHYLCLGYPYSFDCFSVEDVYGISLVYQRLHDGEFVDATDITMGSSCKGSTPLKSSSVKVMSGILSRNDTPFTWCTALRCFFLALLELPPLANPPAIVLITSRSPFLPFPLGGSPLIEGSSLLGQCSGRRSFSYTLRGVVSFSYSFFSSWGPLCPWVPLHELNEMPDLDKFLNLILHGLTVLGGVPVVQMIPTPTRTVDIIRTCCLP